jgi:hypothetical protein
VLLRDRFRRHVTAAEVRELVADLAAVAIVLRDPPDPVAVTRDPNDDYLVALTVVAQADALISGDRDLTDCSLGCRRRWPRAARWRCVPAADNAADQQGSFEVAQEQ